jgi:hypothetical protein
MTPTELYERDFYAWTRRNAELLRAGQAAEADMAHVAEEIEDLGQRERRALLSRAGVLVAHLLKWQAQSDRRTRSREATIRIQRREVARRLADMPSLRAALEESFAECYRDGVLQAVAETNLPEDAFPETPPFSARELLDDGFLP